MRTTLSGRARLLYALAMAAFGVTAMVVTYLLTGSPWWALLALLLAGPAAQILARPSHR